MDRPMQSGDEHGAQQEREVRGLTRDQAARREQPDTDRQQESGGPEGRDVPPSGAGRDRKSPWLGGG
jgi:hypothetical protein